MSVKTKPKSESLITEPLTHKEREFRAIRDIHNAERLKPRELINPYSRKVLRLFIKKDSDQCSIKAFAKRLAGAYKFIGLHVTIGEPTATIILYQLLDEGFIQITQEIMIRNRGDIKRPWIKTRYYRLTQLGLNIVYHTQYPPIIDSDLPTAFKLMQEPITILEMV